MHDAEQRRREQVEERIILELRESGCDVQSLDEFANRDVGSEAIVPILVRWLRQADSCRTKAWIARALTSRWARGTAAVRALVEEYEALPSYTHQSDVGWAIGNALAEIADDEVFDDLVRLARDRNKADGRQMLVLALGRMKDDRVVDDLMEFLEHDRYVRLHALAALRKLRKKAARALPLVRQATESDDATIRREAQKTLRSIERAIGGS